MATTLNVSLPEALKRFVEEEVARGGYGSASEFVREILRDELKRRAHDELERKLLEGLASKPKLMTPSRWKDLRKRALRPRRTRH